MKKIILPIMMVFSLTSSAQIVSKNTKGEPGVKTKGGSIQFGYVNEIVDDDGPFLTGAEVQFKIFFKRQYLKKKEKLDDAIYFNLGTSYFPSKDYELAAFNAGFGAITPIFNKGLQFDFGLGASYYIGSIDGEMWTGKTVDLGGHIGLGIPFGRSFGLYSKFAMPGIISTLIDDNYISPMWLSVGIQF